MMRKTFGQFDTPQDDNPTGSQVKDNMPPIMGAPMPNAGMRNQSMGDVSLPKDKPSPQQFANRERVRERVKKMPDQSPLGPITGGPAKPQARPQARPPMQQQQEPVGTGDQWMGELWQGLTLNEEPQGGFAMGGEVGSTPSPGMDLYNQVTMELESGGVAGYAHGGMVDQSRDIASKGRNGDTMLMHINPQELSGLQSLLGPVTVNPETGNPEAFAWTPLLIGMALGATTAGTSAAAQGGDTNDIVLASLAGGTIGAVGGAAAGAAAPAAVAPTAATAPAAATAPGYGVLASTPAQVTAQAAAAKSAAASQAAAIMGPNPYLSSLGLTAAPAKAAALAPGAGVLAPGYGGGVLASQVPGGIAATTDATMKAGISGAGFQPSGLSASAKKGLARVGEYGLRSIADRRKQQERQPMASASPMPPPKPLGDVPSPYERMRRRRSGISSVPGSGSIV